MTTDRPRWSPDEVDPARPSVARVYDFYLGGSHNFEADREFGRRALVEFPDLPGIALDNRAFLRRAVRYACSCGIRQFLDLGSGIPTAGNVHEVARGVDPGARVVYVDHDPVAVAHGQALLDGDPLAEAVAADLRYPEAVLSAVGRTGLLDPDRPVAVLLLAVLQFVHDDADPAGIVARYMRTAAPSSVLALSHARAGARRLDSFTGMYDDSGSLSTLHLRSDDEVAALFGALRLVEPGVVPLPHWRPELTGDDGPPVDGHGYPALAGVGRRD